MATYILSRTAGTYANNGCFRVAFFSSFLIRKLEENGGYDNVKKWSSKSGLDIFSPCCTALIVPVNIGNAHWCLAVAFMREKRILYYDSMGGPGNSVHLLLQYIVGEARDKKQQVGIHNSCLRAYIIAICFAHRHLTHHSGQLSRHPSLIHRNKITGTIVASSLAWLQITSLTKNPSLMCSR
jgi:hypothetical protein